MTSSLCSVWLRVLFPSSLCMCYSSAMQYNRTWLKSLAYTALRYVIPPILSYLIARAFGPHSLSARLPFFALPRRHGNVAQGNTCILLQ